MNGTGYDAFLSYSHAADHRLAPELQSGLHQLARPWYRLRALRVFRDRSSLAVTPALWPAIEQALRNSRYFIYLASPESAASDWVEREIRWWLEHRATGSILIVLTGGEIDWDDSTNRFSSQRSSALPPVLREAFREEPRYLDLRWARNRDQVSLRLPAFRDAVAELAATLHGKPKDELEGEDVRQHRRTRRVAWAAALMLAALTVASVTAAVLAVRQQRLASERGRIAVARQLAAQATVTVSQSPDRLPVALALAIEAVARYPSAETQRALRSLLSLSPRPVFQLQTGTTPNALSFSPDSRMFAMSTTEGVVIAWNSAGSGRTGTPPDSSAALRWSSDNEAPARALRFSGDGRLIAFAEATRAHVVLAETGQELHVLEAVDTIRSLALSPAGSLLAAGTITGIVQIWSVETAAEQARIQQEDAVNALAFSPDGSWLALIDYGGALCLVRTDAASDPFCRFTRGEGLHLAWLPESNRIVSVSANFAQLWDLTGPRPLLHLEHVDAAGDAAAAHLNWIDDVAVSPDGRLIATAGGIDFSVRIWDAETGRELRRMHHDAGNLVVRFAPRGHLLASGAGDGTVRIWDARRGVERLRGTHSSSVNVLDFDNIGTRLISGSLAGDIILWDLAGGDEIRRIEHSRGPVELAVNVDGSLIATLNQEAWLDVSDSSGILLGRARPAFGLRRLRFLNRDSLLAWRDDDPMLVDLTARAGNGFAFRRLVDSATDVVAQSSSYLIAEDAATDSLLVLAASSGDTLARLAPEAGYRTVSISSDGRLLALERPESHISIVELPSGRERLRVATGSRPSVIRISGDGNRITAILGNQLHIWTVQRGVQRDLPVDSLLQFTNAFLSPDAARVIGWTEDELVLVDGATGRVLARRPEPGSVDKLRFDPSSAFVAVVASRDVRVFDLSHFSLMAEYTGGSGFADVAFTGNRLLTADDDGNIVLRYWRTEDILREACARLNAPLSLAEWQAWLGNEPYAPYCSRQPPT